MRSERLPSEQLEARDAIGSRELPALDVLYPVATATAGESQPPQRFAVILYFSGWPGDSVSNRVLIAELVSHGYAVVTFTYPARLPSMSDADYRRQLDDINIPMDFSSLPALERTTDLFERRVRSRGLDAGLTIDMLQRLQTSDAPGITRLLDLSRIGVLGFSLGGSIANHLCSVDARIRSAVDMDASHWIDPPVGSHFCRLLFVAEAELRPIASEMLSSRNALTRGGAEMDQRDYERSIATLQHFGGTALVIPHTTHLDFSDQVVKSPARRRLHRLIDAGRMTSILNDAVVSFFDATLLSKNASRFEGLQSRYSDISVHDWTPASATAN